MSCDKPGDHKGPKSYVARYMKFEILEYLRKLEKHRYVSYDKSSEGISYRKDDIHNIHKAKYHIAGSCLMIPIAREDQGTGDDMVRKHLPMIFSSFFDVHDQYLLQPKGELNEVVPFEQAVHLSVRPAGPHLSEIEPVRRIIHQILRKH